MAYVDCSFGGSSYMTFHTYTHLYQANQFVVMMMMMLLLCKTLLNPNC